MPVPSRGILLVYTDPGRAVPSPVYERWHDTEHVWPLLNLPGPLFLTATRWTAADTKTPGHLAIYDLAAPGAVHDPSYAELFGPEYESECDSDRTDNGRMGRRSTLRKEARVDVVRKVERMERRVYEPLIDESRASRRAGPVPSPTLSDQGSSSDEDEYCPPPYEPGKYMTIAEMEMETYAEAEFNRWFDEEHIPLLACVPGWVRSRRFVLKEVLGRDGTSVESDGDGDGEGTDIEGKRKRTEWYGSGREVKEERPPKYLALHEWSSLDAFRTKEFKRATTTPWRTEVLKGDRVIKYEMRVFRVARNWQRF